MVHLPSIFNYVKDMYNKNIQMDIETRTEQQIYDEIMELNEDEVNEYIASLDYYEDKDSTEYKIAVRTALFRKSQLMSPGVISQLSYLINRYEEQALIAHALKFFRSQ